jgi:hypothetical protein
VVLLWVVPVVAAAAGIALVLGRLRALEEVALELMLAVHRTREVRAPLAEVRGEMERSAPLIEQVWSHWSSDGGGSEQPT